MGNSCDRREGLWDSGEELLGQPLVIAGTVLGSALTVLGILLGHNSRERLLGQPCGTAGTVLGSAWTALGVLLGQM